MLLCLPDILPVLHSYHMALTYFVLCPTPNCFSHPSPLCFQRCSRTGPLSVPSPVACRACPLSAGASALPLTLAYPSNATSTRRSPLEPRAPLHPSIFHGLFFIYVFACLSSLSPTGCEFCGTGDPHVFYFPPCLQHLNQCLACSVY